MVLIVEGIHIISPHVSDAVKERNPQVIQDFSTADRSRNRLHILESRISEKDPEEVNQRVG